MDGCGLFLVALTFFSCFDMPFPSTYCGFHLKMFSLVIHISYSYGSPIVRLLFTMRYKVNARSGRDKRITKKKKRKEETHKQIKKHTAQIVLLIFLEIELAQ